MGLAATSDVSLDLRLPSFSPAAALLREAVAAAGEGRTAMLEDYLRGLEEERRKIDGFKRELPLCMLILNDVIEELKEELKQSRGGDVPGAGGRPTLEEFMPTKRSFKDDGGMKRDDDDRDKVNWMSSAQLWSDNNSANTSSTTSNTTAGTNNSGNIKKKTRLRTVEDDMIVQDDESPFEVSKCRAGVEAFLPLRGMPVCQAGGGSSREKMAVAAAVPLPNLSFFAPAMKPPCATISSAAEDELSVWPCPRGGSRGLATSPAAANTPVQKQSPRKARRCWSPELHRRFISALQQLGGAQAATPKQIRELMKQDGLTNDEVKSHLQKYRLHTRRAPTNTEPANQPVVMLGGLWLSQEDYPATKKGTSQTGSPQGPLQLRGGDSCEEEDGRSKGYVWKGHMQRASGEETD